MLLYLLNTNIVKFIFILSPIGSFFAMIAQLTVSIQASTPVVPDPDSEWHSGVTYRDLDPELCDYGHGARRHRDACLSRGPFRRRAAFPTLRLFDPAARVCSKGA